MLFSFKLSYIISSSEAWKNIKKIQRFRGNPELKKTRGKEDMRQNFFLANHFQPINSSKSHNEGDSEGNATGTFQKHFLLALRQRKL